MAATLPPGVRTSYTGGHTIWHVLGFLIPIIMVVVGYFVPVLQYRVVDTFSIPDTELGTLWLWIIFELLVGIAWVIMDVVIISSNLTHGGQLKANAMTSSTILNVLMFITGGMVFTNKLQWWLVVPVVFALIDDYLVTNRAIVNALQKPIAEAPRG